MAPVKLPLLCVFATLILSLSSVSGDVDSKDPTAGLDCIKDKSGKIIACQGDNPVLKSSKTKIDSFVKDNNDDVQTKIQGLQTRFGGPGVSGGSGPPGVRPGMPQYCQKGSCQTSVNQIYTPSLLYNVNGEARFVLQMPNFNQFVFLAVCESETSSCVQKRFTYNLLVWDPFYPEAGLYVESFEVPSGCCTSGGYGYTRRPYYNPNYGQSNPNYGQDNPNYDQDNPNYGQDNPSYGQDNPNYGPSNPNYDQGANPYG